MSNRVAVPNSQKDIVWMRDIEDRVKAQETRQVQGDIALDTLTAANLTYSATRTNPATIVGSATWTEDIEFLGIAGPTIIGTNGQHALVTRDPTGRVQDIVPAPFAQIAFGTPQSIASTTVVPLTMAGGAQYAAPYAAVDCIGANGTGQLIIPQTGIYNFISSGAWPNVLGTKGRVVIIQISSDGGVTWPTLFADGRSGINTASLGQDVACVGRSAMVKGWRVRTAVIQDEVGALTYTPSRFSFMWESGYNGG